MELGVHYMTAYRYVRHGYLAATKVGGEWKVSRVEIDRFRREHRPVREVPSAGTGSGRKSAPWASRLEARLIAGDSGGASAVIDDAVDAGNDIESVYLDVIAPALVSIGEKWHHKEIDISIEHRATTMVTRLIGQLGGRASRRGRSRGTVVLGAVEGEMHSVPLLILADIVRLAGYEVSDLGPNTPPESFVNVVKVTDGVVAVGVSVFNQACRDVAARTLAGLREAVDDDVVLFAGGAVVADKGDAISLGADEWAANARDFVAVLNATVEARRARSKRA